MFLQGLGRCECTRAGSDDALVRLLCLERRRRGCRASRFLFLGRLRGFQCQEPRRRCQLARGAVQATLLRAPLALQRWLSERAVTQ